MKKLLVLLPIAALAPLLMTLLASAQPVPGGRYWGPVDVGGAVQFDVSADGLQVLNFVASDVPGTIPGAGGPCAFQESTYPPIPLDIVSNAFGDGIPNFYELSGSFPGPDTAQGTLRLTRPDIPGVYPACDTGTVSWSATGGVSTATPTATATATGTATAVTTGTPTPTPSPTPSPTASPTPSPTPTATPSATPSPTPSPTPAGPPQTALTAAAAAGASQISVADTALFAVGDFIEIGGGASLDITTIDGIGGGAPGIFALISPLEFDHKAGEAVVQIPAPTPTPSPTATDTPTPAATPQFTLTPKATTATATATPIAPPPTGSGGDGGIGGLGLALALLLAAALLAGTASLIAFSFRQRD